jgi:iron complex outermembrane recepter protein
MKSIQNISLFGLVVAFLFPATSIFAQTTNAPEAATIEEVLVTGRKRSENLTDVPISISVFNAEALGAQGINSEDDLFAATPGLDYSNFNGSRQANNPGVRGVQSDLRASNQQKVTSFIDGTPILGNSGTIQFAGVDAVEVYRGPQSAAFGRSTFAGAINYVTADAPDEFEGEVLAAVSEHGREQFGVRIAGPLTDSLGYILSYQQNDWQGPDEWTATDGVQMGSEETEDLRLKLNFEFSDTAYGELTFNRLETFDQEGAQWIAPDGTCTAGSGIYRNSMGTDTEMPSGAWNCDLDIPNGHVPRNHDVLGQFTDVYNANVALYETAVGMAFATLDTDGSTTLSVDEYLAQRLPDGSTFLQALEAQTFAPGNENTKDRIQGELNFEIGDSLLQFLGMHTEDSSFRWNQNQSSDTHAVFAVNMMGIAALNANVMNMLVPIDIEEKYAEVRWISPETERLRYTLSGSYYDYSLQQQVYNNGGALVYGQVYEGTGDPLVDGQPVFANPGITISEVATNIGASFGLQYDLTDRTTLSLEGRYQVDEVCGVDENGANVEFCQETKAFLPRLSVNTTISDSMSVYGQVSIGNNPAGVNIAYQDPGNIEALLVASGQIVSPYDGFTYDGSDGIHFAAVDYDADTFPEFKEETLTNFEVGAKGSFADRRGSYTAAVYFMIYEDIIGAENLNWDDDTTDGWNEDLWTDFTGERTWINQGDGEMYGIELTADYALDDIWTVGGYVTLSSAKYTDYCSIQAPEYRDAPGGAAGGGSNTLPILTPAADGVLSSCGVVDGNWIPRQTPFTANFNVSATLPNDLFGMRTSLRADVRHKGSYFEDHLNLLEREPVTLVNLSANMRSDNWTLRFYVDNLTDNQEPSRVSLGNYYANDVNPTVATSQVGSWSIVPTRPREVGFSVGYNF